ncbi:MAG TPA: hypothetical protein VGI46_21730 [Candidatus Acidoferrum sp.]
MKRPLLVCVLLFGAIGVSISANSQDTASAVSVDGICGKLVSIEEVPDKGTTKSAHEIVKPFEHTRVRLFSPTAGADCCSLMTPIAEVTTGRDGSFQFKKQTPGDYWVVATLSGAEYKLLIRYEPLKKVATDCSKALYVLQKGKFQLQRTETVTVH